VANHPGAAPYSAEYYAAHLGLPYDRSQPHWLQFFGSIAEAIIRELKPRRVFDVGCAKGFLVEALRDRGVEAWGSDVSEYAIGEVRPDLRDFCSVRSAAEPIPGLYDLVTCIEVLEHLSDEEGRAAVRNMTAVSDQVLFSSTPADFSEPTHINVRPVIYWLKLFRDSSFAADPGFDASFVCPQAILLRRTTRPPTDEELFEVALARHVAVETAPLRVEIAETLAKLELERASKQQVLAEKDRLLAEKNEDLAGKEAMLQAIFNSKGWKLLNRYRELKAQFSRQGLARTALRVLSRQGFVYSAARLISGKRRLTVAAEEYEQWIAVHERPSWDPVQMRSEIAQFQYAPKISVIMPTYNTPQDYLKKAVDSVAGQIYENWELCICDDHSTVSNVFQYLQQRAAGDERIKLNLSEKNGGISDASNRALTLATGEFVGFLDHDDELSPAALYEVVKLLQSRPEADIIYSDEDKLQKDGKRCDAFFKPDWSPEYLLACNYVCHFGVYRKKLVDEVGGFRPGFEGSQDYDLLLRVVEKTRRVFHIPRILYHWRKTPQSTAAAASAKTYSTDAGKRAIQEHLDRCGIAGTVVTNEVPNVYRVRPHIKGQPLVSIIIPTRDGVRFLRRCLRSIEEKTTYSNYEILIVDNGSVEAETLDYFRTLRHRVLPFEEPFNFSRLNNFAAKQARGGYLVLLNNDTEVVAGEWLSSMLELCQLEGIGIVGAKLYYPDRTIQHAGVVLGLSGGVADHSHKHFSGRSYGYFGALKCIRNYSAVTAACMMVRKEVFDAVGGFDEQLQVAFNDVDFCLRVRDQGYRIVWTPYCELIHHESVSRGFAMDWREVELMQRRWGQALLSDPYYNPNLTLKDGKFGIRL
jgi:GT2 family glycosyltransferase/SAM-dependent methyltransferase